MPPDPWTTFDVTDQTIDPEQMDAELLRRAGADLPTVDLLQVEIWRDMDTDAHGVKWWQEHLDERRRILIGDHLVQCVGSIGDNLLEASLHKIQALHELDAIDRRLARVVTPDGVVRFPPATSPRDPLHDKLLRLNVAGFFRALGSSLDCLAAAIIGVLGFEEDMLRADFKRLRARLASVSTKLPMWRDFSRDLDALIRNNGPAGWDGWVSDYRNMLVHRARRVEFNSLDSKAYVLDHRSRVVPRTHVTSHLVRDPSLSDIEALARQIHSKTVHLQEDGRATMEATHAAVKDTAEGVAKLLLPIWNERRSKPALLAQPSGQWPDAERRLSGFEGFEPGKVPFNPNAMITDPRSHDRMRFAAIVDGANAIWRDYFK